MKIKILLIALLSSFLINAEVVHLGSFGRTTLQNCIYDPKEDVFFLAVNTQNDFFVRDSSQMIKIFDKDDAVILKVKPNGDLLEYKVYGGNGIQTIRTFVPHQLKDYYLTIQYSEELITEKDTFKKINNWHSYITYINDNLIEEFLTIASSDNIVNIGFRDNFLDPENTIYTSTSQTSFTFLDSLITVNSPYPTNQTFISVNKNNEIVKLDYFTNFLGSVTDYKGKSVLATDVRGDYFINNQLVGEETVRNKVMYFEFDTKQLKVIDTIFSFGNYAYLSGIYNNFYSIIILEDLYFNNNLVYDLPSKYENTSNVILLEINDDDNLNYSLPILSTNNFASVRMLANSENKYPNLLVGLQESDITLDGEDYSARYANDVALFKHINNKYELTYKTQTSGDFGRCAFYYYGFKDKKLWFAGEFNGNVKFDEDDSVSVINLNDIYIYMSDITNEAWVSEPEVKKIAKSSSTFSMFPNPSTDFINLQVSEPVASHTALSVYNLTGQLVYSKSIAIGSRSETINISALSKGTYLVKLSNNEGIQTQKLIVR